MITIEPTRSFIIIITPYHTCVRHINQRVVEPPYRHTRRSITIEHTRSFLHLIIIMYRMRVDNQRVSEPPNLHSRSVISIILINTTFT